MVYKDYTRLFLVQLGVKAIGVVVGILGRGAVLGRRFIADSDPPSLTATINANT